MNRILSKSDIRVLISPEIATESIRNLARDFKKYKLTGNNFSMFGRDVPFTDEACLHQAGVWKVHVLEIEEFNEIKSQYNNTTDKFHLVYCQHPEHSNFYCIIHVLSPEAHKQARRREFVAVAERRAEEFITAINHRMKKSA